MVPHLALDRLTCDSRLSQILGSTSEVLIQSSPRKCDVASVDAVLILIATSHLAISL